MIVEPRVSVPFGPGTGSCPLTEGARGHLTPRLGPPRMDDTSANGDLTMDQRRQSVMSRVLGLLRRAGQIGRQQTMAPSASVRESCVTCGEETAVGSVFFSDRLTVSRPRGADAFLCRLCDERIRSSRKGQRLTDEEVAGFIRSANAAFITLGSSK